MTESRKKIALIATIPFAFHTHMRAYIAMLAERYDVTLVASGKESELQTLLTPNVCFKHVDVLRKVAPWADVQALWALVHLFRTHRFDVVHSIMPKTGLLAMVAAFIACVPHRVHMFTGQVWANKSGFARSCLKALDKLTARCATRLLADSFSQRRFLIDERVVDSQKIAVLGQGSICGVDSERFQFNETARRERRQELGIAEDDLVFLYLGRVNQDKGILDLAQAFVNISVQLPHAHLLVVGPDEEGMDAALQHMLAPCAARFHRIGLTDKPEDYMSCSDVFCLPSYREGFGSVIIEAASVGLPAIASRIYGLIDSVCEGQTGILHEPKHIQQIQDAMLRLAGDHTLRSTMAQRALERARTVFDQKTMVEAMRRYYDEFQT
jgi:glycosyltransferase involved in cell wall biosynthesis